MAAAVSSMENGSRFPLSRVPPPPPPADSSAHPSLRLQPRSPSSSSNNSAPLGGATINARRSGNARITTTTPPSPSGNNGGSLSAGGTGGVWASIISLGAAALPSSLLPFSSSSAPPSPRARQAGQAARAGSSSGSGSRLSRHRAAAAAVAARAAGAANAAGAAAGSVVGVAGARSVGSVGNAYSLLYLPSSASASAAPGARVSAGARSPTLAAPASGMAAAPGAVAGNQVMVSGNIDRALVVAAGLERGRQEERHGRGGNAVVVIPSAEAVAPARRKDKRVKKVYLEGGGEVYTCSVCRAHLATRDHVVSECFHGHGGRAFLFERCVNVTAGKPEDRELMTGMHVVADITCTSCGAELGWKYESAAEPSQKYKERKFILERCAVTLEGSSGDGYTDTFNSRYSSADRCGSDGYKDRYGSGSEFVGWGTDRAPISGSRW